MRRTSRILGAAVLAVAFLHASAGLRWSEFFHPDELPIAHWMQLAHDNGYVTERAYPGGWFVLSTIWTRADAAIWRIQHRWKGWRNQSGAVKAVDSDSFDFAPQGEKFRAGDIQRGRDLNAFLAAFAALFLYLAALEAGAHPLAAALGALLLAMQPFLLEHSHYCETDTAVPFALSLAGWLSMRAVRLRSGRWHLAAMAAAGFAIACKYTLAPLVLWPVAAAVPIARAAEPGHRARRFAALALGGVLTLALGFLAGTPALWLAPRFFLRSLRHISRRTYAEGARALGSAYYSRSARIAWRASSLARELARLGTVPLALYALSFPVWLRRRNLRFLGILPLVALAFAPQAVFLMPWIRNQEMLPLLPPLCLGVALAADAAARALLVPGTHTARAFPWRRLAAGVALVAILAASVVPFRDGRRVLSSFQRRDTRAECQNWLDECAADGLRVALDRYVSQSVRGTPCDGLSHPSVAESWPRYRRHFDVVVKGVRYVLRNGSYRGRQVAEPGEDKRVAAFRRDCLPLRSWRIVPGRVRTLPFSQPDIELWALPIPSEADAPDLPVVLDRPVFFTPGLRPLYAADAPSPVGPVRAVQTVGQRHTYHPAPDPNAPNWAVSRVVAGPVAGSVHWEGLAEPLTAPLAGRAGVALFSFPRPALAARSRSDIRPSSRLRLRGADDQRTICATWPVADRAEAARALRRGGDPAAALALLRKESAPSAAECVEAFLAAAESGEKPDPGWIDAARDTLATLEAALPNAAGDAPLRVRGVPLRVERDFAHLRLFNHPLPIEDSLPVFLPSGTYRISLLPLKGQPPPRGHRWFEGQVGEATPRTDAKGNTWWDTEVRMRRESLLRTVPAARAADADHGLAFRRVTLAWDPTEQLERLAAELRRALRP